MSLTIDRSSINNIIDLFNLNGFTNLTNKFRKLDKQISCKRFNLEGSTVYILSHTPTLSKTYKIDNITVASHDLCGIILDHNYKPICIPPRTAYTRNKYKKSDEFKFYKLHDGTVVTLYYYNKWYISTMNGVNVTDLVPSYTNKTFKELFEESVDDDFDSFTSNLDTDCNYTFVFTHKDLHKHSTENDCWFISFIDLNTSIETYEKPSNIKVKEDKEIDPSDVSAYGLILRSGAVNYKIETPLMVQIKKFWYNSSIFKCSIKNKELVVLLNVYAEDEIEEFLHIFPKYIKHFQLINDEVDSIIELIINSNKTKNNKTEIFASEISSCLQKIRSFKYEPALIYSWLFSSDNFTNMVEYFSSYSELVFE